MRSIMFLAVCAACIAPQLGCSAGARDVGRPQVQAQQAASGELRERTLHRRAIEAVIWGMPAVNYERMLQAAIANGAQPNQVVYWSRPVNWRNQTLTPNPDTIYLNPFYDTTNGPVVLEIPPVEGNGVIVGSADDAWQNALVDFGPAGVDQGRGGKFLITPPGYAEAIPDGHVALPSQTFRGFVILRSNFKSRSDADIAAAVAHGKKVKLYPLGASPDSTVFVDAYDKAFDATIPYDGSYFELLDRFVQAEPWQTRDKLMIEYLRSVGIRKGQPFQPDSATRRLLVDAVQEAKAVVAQQYESGFAASYWDRSRWAVPIPAETVEGMQTAFADPDSYAIDGRAAMYSIAYFSPKQLGAGQFYVLSIRDADGRSFDGAKTYKLSVPANAPVEQYWSVTAYDRETHALIRNMSHASRASQMTELRVNADGSTDVYFGPRPPAGNEGNWVPTDAQREFELLFRFYGPTKPLFDKTWKLPDVVAVK
jgi:hypothetical protein